MALTLTEEQLDGLVERIPDAPRSPLGGRPAADKRKVMRGIFWILDNGAKWKDLSHRFGSKSTVHRWFQHFRRLCILWEKSTQLFSGFLHFGCTILLLREVLG